LHFKYQKSSSDVGGRVGIRPEPRGVLGALYRPAEPVWYTGEPKITTPTDNKTQQNKKLTRDGEFLVALILVKQKILSMSSLNCG